MKPINKPHKWDSKIQMLEDFFNDAIKKPIKGPITLSKGQTIIDVKKFVETSLNSAKSNKGNVYYIPCMIRLNELKKILELL